MNSYRRLRTTYPNHLEGHSSPKIFSSETSANNYEITPHNIPEDRRPLLHREKSLKFSTTNYIYSIFTAIQW